MEINLTCIHIENFHPIYLSSFHSLDLIGILACLSSFKLHHLHHHFLNEGFLFINYIFLIILVYLHFPKKFRKSIVSLIIRRILSSIRFRIMKILLRLLRHKRLWLNVVPPLFLNLFYIIFFHVSIALSFICSSKGINLFTH